MNSVENNDKLFMQRALELALKGKGQVEPNPLVGCVIVRQGKIIGEGWHQKYGEAHAEQNAIESIQDKSLLPGSTAYVTLEPCAHYGKTPPCCDLMVTQKVGRVIVCNVDPNPLVNGKGIRRMKAAGIQVETGLLAREGRKMNEEFFKRMEKKKANTAV